jgi:uncharacterized lipoprotein YddW (UPF0748 family)
MQLNSFYILFFIFSLFYTNGQTKVSRISPLDANVYTSGDKSAVVLPEINREFRGVWISTVANINWPSKNNLSVDQQKAEVIQMLDLLKSSNFNAVILQARPSADALYKSNLEPWSYFLTGETGKNPFPYYDPLQFWIEETHKRGMELHVWMNPFRASHSTGGPITAQSMVKKMPNQVVKLRNGMYWFDPADPATQNHVSNVVKDILKNYDVDGIHFDDYFYPYKEYNGGADFPDAKSWLAYQKSGGMLSKADWRREQVNQFVKRIYSEIKAEKNYVKFGISPFGIWKPGYPEGITGSSQYDELFADAKLWLNEGWVDYFSPQLYWKIGGNQDFESLLNWWQQENKKNRHLFPGLNTVGLKNVTDKPQEIVNQILLDRKLESKDKGVIHWSIAGITKNYTMLQAVRNIYKDKALAPLSPWLKASPLSKPSLYTMSDGEKIKINWFPAKNEKANNWVLFLKYDNDWKVEILDAQNYTSIIDRKLNGKNINSIAIKAIDRLGNESPAETKILNY